MLKIYLEARHYTANLARFYLMWLAQDLLGDWTLKTTYGRIGTQGRHKTYAFKRVEEAVPKIKSILSKRASAPRRSGCPYQLIEIYQDSSLPSFDLETFLQTSCSIQESTLKPKKTVFPPLPLFDI